MTIKNVVSELEKIKESLLKEANKPKILNGCFIVIDKDGDFVDACSARMPSNTLESVVERVNKTHPENAPFRIIKWTGYEFVEVTAVS